MSKRKLVMLTGAGISAESGLQTFRGSDGLWEGHRIEDVASPEGFLRDPANVLRFYNERRDACLEAEPNVAHYTLVELEEYFEVSIITQNIDDLHERAGSSCVLHLHGEIMKSQSSIYPTKVFDLNGRHIKMGDKCPRGSQLRPHVVWFGEAVPNMEAATKLTRGADIFVIIGTSLQVYPAANLIYEVSDDCLVYLIDPSASNLMQKRNMILIAEKATVAVPKLLKMLTE